MIKKMKTLVILFADFRSKHIFEKSFGGFSAFDLTLKWAESIKDSETVIFYYGNMNFDSNDMKKVRLDLFTVSELFKKMSETASESGCKKIVYSFADLPFINKNITDTLLETHTAYKAEYTFADGYPYGFSPEIIDTGTVKILSSLSENTYAEAGKNKITRTSVYDFLKLDINSFEIEVEVCDEDLGLLRLYFDAGTKLNFRSCLALFEKLGGKKCSSLTQDEIIELTKSIPEIYKTVPSYYSIQVSSKADYKTIFEPDFLYSESDCFMPVEKYSEILKKISETSEEAVINPSFFGEPLLHPDFFEIVEKTLSNPDFTLLIETDGLNVTEELVKKLSEIADSKEVTNSFDLGRIIWIVKIDAFSAAMYSKLHGGCDGFEKAVNAVKLINQYFPKKVYPQFVRCLQNEEELEAFWRYWNEKENGSSGNVLIQKYSSFCKKLPDLKSADLSPLERNACYHLRRDFNIFIDGSVPLCRETMKTIICGNIFEKSIEEIFIKSDEEFASHLKNSYCEACLNCDEYYTFNF